MKNSTRHSGRQGFALLLVLIVVSFAAVIAVMFLLSARQEHAGSSAYVQGSAVRQLASAAVNIVIGQISAATHEGTMATPISWASQPGMIRTYKSAGTLSNAYKLYSWASMTEAGTAFNPTALAELPASTWATLPGQYTDLNLPVNGIYPIADPNVFDTATTNTGFAANNPGGITWDFPGEAGIITGASGYFPSASNAAPMPVQWLYVLQDGTWVTPSSVTGNTITIASATATNPIVGRIAFWTDDETAKVNLNTAGEGAYWDTPKAGTTDELQFAGNPPLQTEYYRLSGHPATTSISAVFPEIRAGAATFNRWLAAGGPNTTYLSALEALFGYGSSGSATIHGLNPRLTWGADNSTHAGSQGGTFPVNSYLELYQPQVSAIFPSGFVAASSYAPGVNTDRLYATVDDAFFQPGQGSSATRSVNSAFSNYGLTAKMLSQRKFFLTADSKAPETTLFDTPRISMWPITWPYAKSSYYISGGRTVPPQPTTLTPSPANLNSNPYMAYQEKLLAFCSTLNSGSTTTSSIYPYYFQRQNPDSSSYDWSNITRNQNLVNYLANELSDPKSASPYPTAPGIGASLGAKWDADKAGTTDWITLNCFDYIRSMINQYTIDPTSSAGSLLYSYTGVNLGAGSGYTEPNSFTVAPLNVTMNGTQYATQGTYPALREAACVFYATKRNIPTLKPQFLGSPLTATKLSDVVLPANWNNLITYDNSTRTGNTQTIKMKMVMLLNFSEMNPGIVSTAASTAGVSTGQIYSAYHPVFWVKVSTPSGSSPFQVDGNGINFPLSTGNVVQISPINTAPLATSPGWEASLYATSSSTQATAKVFSNTTSGAGVWTLVSDEITLATAGEQNFTFTGSKVQFDIYAIDPSGNVNTDPTTNAANKPVYTYQMDFSKWNATSTSFYRGNGKIPVPIAPYWNTRQGQMMVVTPPSTTATALSQYKTPSADTIETAASLPGGGGYATTTVSGGVLMPYNLNGGTSLATGENWQAEIVTRGPNLHTVRTNSSPQMNFPWGQGTSLSVTQAIMDAADTTYILPLMYVYQDNAWDGTEQANMVMSGPNLGTNYSSTIFEDRVRAAVLNAAISPAYNPTSTNPAQGETIDHNNSYGFTVPWVASAGNPAGLLFSDTTSDYTNAMQAYNVITPYDSVLSMVAEPRSGSSAAAGDPRLTGRGLATSTGTGSVTFTPLSVDAGQVCQSMPTADSSQQPVYPFANFSGGFSPKSGVSTYGAQYHELDSTGPIPTTTGVKPQWQFVGPTQTIATGSPMAAKGAVTLTALNLTPTNTNYLGSNFWSNGLLMGYNDPSAGLGLDANVLMSLTSSMDWTQQPGSFPDGGYVLRPDQEYQSLAPKSSGTPLALNVPYFNDGAALPQNYGSSNLSTGFFSPSRQVPSPVILGTLPDSMVTGWQTLNFCPNPAVTMSGGAPHPGQGVAAAPSATAADYTKAPDHLLLDLFWMPASEPYPISEEFATAGKVNLNYAMMPFPYIQRKTALDALLKSVMITAMPDPTVTPSSSAQSGNQFPPFPQNYKSYGMLYQLNREDLTHTRYPVNVDATLRAFDYRFQQGDIFRSASQICDMFLYPNDPNTPNTLWGGDTFSTGITGADTAPSTANITAWWKANSFTADNERESPYSALYSRVTTKSNTYTVHWKVQTLKKTPGDPTKWVEGTDKVTAELRGSTLIERYIDPGSPLPDYATNTTPTAGGTVQPMGYYYKWRIASDNYFRPSP
jgi:uncharacterized protein (TIGR02600 family)